MDGSGSYSLYLNRRSLFLNFLNCDLLFCLHNVTLNYKNKLVYVLFSHSNLNNCSFLLVGL